MKPIYLKMTAFGSYAGTAEIDFSQLYDNGIFLITGKTGGGKTTILDAMCMALYGKATGSERAKEWRQLRCSNAPNSRDTEIEFIFSLGDVRYKFCRRWHVPNTRNGEYKVNDSENACYIARGDTADWELVASGTSNHVNSAAEDILKLTQTQFVKVIMLPQGEFRELLTASSDEKTAIFKKLFDTERWELITDRISEEFRRTENLCRDHTGRLAASLHAAGCDSAEALHGKTSQCQSVLAALQTQKAQNAEQTQRAASDLKAAEEIAALFAEREKQRAALQTLDGQSDQYRAWESTLARSRRLRGVLPEYNLAQAAGAAASRCAAALKQAAADEKQAIRALEEAQKSAETVPSLEETRRRLLTDIARLDELAGDRAAYDTAAGQIARDEAALQQNQQVLETLANAKNETEARIAKGTEYLESCHTATTQLNDAVQKRHELEQLFRVTSEYEEKTRQAAALSEKIRAAEARVKTDEAELQVLQAAVLTAEQAIMNDKAYSLAAGLAEGFPCPVCGSTHHPHPALPANEAVTSAQLTLCKQNADRYARALEAARTDLAALTTRHDMLQKDIAAILEKTDGSLSRTAAEYQTTLEAARQEETRLRDLASKTGKARELLGKLSDALTANQKDTEAAVMQGNNLRLRIAANRQTLQSIADRLAAQSITDFTALAQKQTELRRSLSHTETSIRDCGEAVTAAMAAQSSAHATLTAAENALGAARAEQETRQAEFLAKCAALDIPAETDIPAGVLSESDEAALEQRISDYGRQRSFAKTRIDELSAGLKEKSAPPLAELQAVYDAAMEEGHRISRQIGDSSAQLKMLTETADAVDRETKALETLQKQYDTAKRMYQLLSGQNNARTPIHQYVIGIKMDEIIMSANLYMNRLTNGQYAMKRKETVGGRAKHQGLDIEILDSAAGRVRPVATLSGGELFLASLSLAFGLSDVVQSFAGGIRLDSLFIDEGFGSLDSETLDTAMEAITQVRENKLLGIISHVSELKERIPCGIEVIKTADGSTLKLINNAEFGIRNA